MIASGGARKWLKEMSNRQFDVDSKENGKNISEIHFIESIKSYILIIGIMENTLKTIFVNKE